MSVALWLGQWLCDEVMGGRRAGATWSGGAQSILTAHLLDRTGVAKFFIQKYTFILPSQFLALRAHGNDGLLSGALRYNFSAKLCDCCTRVCAPTGGESTPRTSGATV